MVGRSWMPTSDVKAGQQKRNASEGMLSRPIFSDLRARVMMITIGFIAALLPWVWWDSSIDVQMASLPLSLLDFLLVMDIEFQLIGLCYLVGLVLCASRTFRPMLAGTILALTSIALFVIKLYSMSYVFSGGWMIRIDSIGIGVVVASVAVLLLIPFAYRLHLDEKLKKA